MGKSSATGLQDYERRELAERVAQVIDSVRRRGDDALREHTRRDGGFAPAQWRIDAAEVRACIEQLPSARLEELRRAVRDAGRFAAAQRGSIADVDVELGDGARRGLRHLPLAAAAVLVPQGAEHCLDAVHASLAAARAAGVGRIVGCAWPHRDRARRRALIAAMTLGGVDEIYAVAGVQAVAALAFGTESIPRVELVAGPAEPAVSEAKRQLFGERGIDLAWSAGDLVILAEGPAQPGAIAVELLRAAAAGDGARATLITDSVSLAAAVGEEIARAAARSAAVASDWRRGGSIRVASDRAGACELADRAAPERLAVLADDPSWYLARVSRAGSLQVGIAGAGTPLLARPGGARSAPALDGLWIGHFLRRVPFSEDRDAGEVVLAMRAARPHAVGAHAG